MTIIEIAKYAFIRLDFNISTFSNHIEYILKVSYTTYFFFAE